MSYNDLMEGILDGLNEQKGYPYPAYPMPPPLEEVFNATKQAYNAGKRAASRLSLPGRKRSRLMSTYPPSTYAPGRRRRRGPTTGVVAKPRTRGYSKKVPKRKRKKRSLLGRVLWLEKQFPSLKWTFHKGFITGSFDTPSNGVNYEYFTLAKPTDLNDIVTTAATAPKGGEVSGAIEDKPVGAGTSGVVKYIFKNLRAVLQLKNNNNIEIKMHLMWIKPKGRHSESPSDSFSQGMLNHGHQDTSPTITSDPRINLNSSHHFRKTWTITSQKYVILSPGESMKTTIHAPSYFKFDQQSWNDLQLAYDSKFTRILVIRAHGPVVHDTTDDAFVGIGAASCDWIRYDFHQVRLEDGGAANAISESFADDTIADGEGVNPEAPNAMEDYDVTE